MPHSHESYPKYMAGSDSDCQVRRSFQGGEEGMGATSQNYSFVETDSVQHLCSLLTQNFERDKYVLCYTVTFMLKNIV